MNPEILKFFAKYIETELGIVYSDHNYFQLQNRLEEVARILDLGSATNLFEAAQGGIKGFMKQLILDISTNNETSFFRDQKIFDAISSHILNSEEMNKSHDRKLKIWSAASSTGQEAVSTAILIEEFNQKTTRPIDFSIQCTDVSERVLSYAKAGTYSQLEVQRGLPTNLLVKYFKNVNQNEKWQVNDSIKNRLKFDHLNLKSKFNLGVIFDLILIRNVLIYQNVEGKVDILNRVSSHLRPGGTLILGSGESLIGLSNEYAQCNVNGAVVYKKIDSAKKAA
jgi:chemotaxis protein methyltransferase CheR